MGAATSTSRRWYQLHRSTYVICLLEAAVLAALIVPGDLPPNPWADDDLFSYSPTVQQYAVAPQRESARITLTSFGADGMSALSAAIPGQCFFYRAEHGWPWPYLESGYGSGEPAWMNVESWSHADWKNIRLGPLLADALVAFLILAFTAAVCEFRRRRRLKFWQFSLREVFVGTSVIAAALAWWGQNAWSAQREAAARAAIEGESSGGRVGFSTRSYAPRWLHKLAGSASLQAFDRVYSIRLWDWSESLDGKKWPFASLLSPDDALNLVGPHLAPFSKVMHVSIRGPWSALGLTYENVVKQRIGAGLRYLQSLPNLQSLDLSSCPVGDDAMPYIQRLTNLRELQLANTQATDAGLIRLRGLDKLQVLNLRGTSISDFGLEYVPELASLEVLDISCNSKITDTAVRRLSRLTHLRQIDLRLTSVTDEGFDELLKALPQLEEDPPDGNIQAWILSGPRPARPSKQSSQPTGSVGGFF